MPKTLERRLRGLHTPLFGLGVLLLLLSVSTIIHSFLHPASSLFFLFSLAGRTPTQKDPILGL